MGSGFLTHGLPYLTREQFMGNGVPAWSADFDQWAAAALDAGDVDTLAAYRDRAPGMPYAHPTVEHFVPLFITLGAATRPDAPVETTDRRASSSAWPSGRSRSPDTPRVLPPSRRANRRGGNVSGPERTLQPQGADVRHDEAFPRTEAHRRTGR